MEHKTKLDYVEFDKLVEDIGNLRYDVLAEFIYKLHTKIFKDSMNDALRDRPELASALYHISCSLYDAGKRAKIAWKICKKYM